MAKVSDYPVISKAKARLLMDHPFFATLLLTTEIKLSDVCEYAATDMRYIYLNPDYVTKAKIGDLMSDLCHEIGHNALLHSARRGPRNADLWNQACDHAINLMLEDQGFKPPMGGWLADPQYKGWSAEKIYDDLRKRQEKGGGQSPRDRMHGDVLDPNGRL